MIKSLTTIKLIYWFQIKISLTPFTLVSVNFEFQAGLANLRDVLFFGNPIYDDMPKEQARIEVLKRLPQVAKIDGDMVKPAEREIASGVAA